MRALAPAAVPALTPRRRQRPAAPRAAPEDGAALLADVVRPQPGLIQSRLSVSQCATLGVRFETTSAAEAGLWEDDYGEVVADAEDSWGREGGAVQGLPPPPWLSSPAPPSAYEGAAFRRVRASELAQHLAASGAFVVDVSADVTEAPPLPPGYPRLSLPLASLGDAARRGDLEVGRVRGLLCVGRDAEQAAVRLARVLGFADVAALVG